MCVYVLYMYTKAITSLDFQQKMSVIPFQMYVISDGFRINEQLLHKKLGRIHMKKKTPAIMEYHKT